MRQDHLSIMGPLIDGVVRESAGDGRHEVINPSCGQRLLSIPIGHRIDVEHAVGSARRAFDEGSWSTSPPSARKAVLHTFADALAKDAGHLNHLDALEMGKPVRETLFDARSAAGLARFYAEAVDKITGDVFASDRASFVAQRRVPRGVIGAITPWNFPTFNAVLKVVPALAAGNSVILKPSELSSTSATRLGQIALEAGVPPGAFNVVPGLGEVTGRALALHQGVDMIAFTGSTLVGRRMLQYAGRSNMKTVMAECGGKSPHIVFADGIEVPAVAESIARSLLANQGQICSVGSRILVERSIEEPLVHRLLDHVRNIVLGDAASQATTFGPLASADQCRRVMRYIDAGCHEGAELVCGGKRILEGSGGYFVEPTIFRKVAPDALIAQEEIFGPVLAVIPFDDEEEAVRIANDTIYGLASYVWTTDLSRGFRMIKGLRSTVMVNAAVPTGEGPGHAFSSEPAAQSGIGIEGGLTGMESYMRRQLVWLSHT